MHAGCMASHANCAVVNHEFSPNGPASRALPRAARLAILLDGPRASSMAQGNCRRGAAQGACDVYLAKTMTSPPRTASLPRIALILLCQSVMTVAMAHAADPPVDFANVQKIFVEHCYQCHGPDKQESGLRLDQRAAALAGGESGPWFTAGKPERSELLRRVTSTGDERMPPATQNKPLTADEIQTLTRWIAADVPWPETAGAGHWAFQPITRPAIPTVQQSGWIRNPLDAFVLAPLQRKGIAPSPEADRATLIKRLFYDLVGLPPSVEEVDAFVCDTAPDAYDRLVDRLLDSPRFGERWGRHWLDMARYADSDGYEKDNPRPDAWRYRDWVIDAINADLPLDQFTITQLAGDLLPDAGSEERLATAFHRQTLTNTEGGADQEQFRVEAIFDRLATTGSVWLGLTVGCAQCHTHKYDPISHHEYYRLFAFFNNTDEVESEIPLTGLGLAKWIAEREDAVGKLAKTRAKLDKQRADVLATQAEWEAELQAAAASPLQFHPVELTGTQSAGGAEIKQLSDGSLLIAGNNPDLDTLTINARSELPQISGFRLEALAHDSLGGRGPGRTEHGNFVLSEFRCYAAATSEIKPEQQIKTSAAHADFSQAQFPASAAIDSKDTTGWAIVPQTGRDHTAMFFVKESIDGSKTPWLRIVLTQNHGQRHTLGRVRLSAITGHDPLLDIPETIRPLLAIAPAARTADQSQALADYYVGRDAKVQELREQIKTLEDRVAARPVMKARTLAQRADKPRTSHVLHRGDFLQPADEVQPGTLSALPPMKPRGERADRLDFARWLVDPAHPLTRRVMMNQLWANLFGRGIVRTANDFGVRGDRPTHPELLDYLASELVTRGWSRKAIIRLVVSSATYRQASVHRPELVASDPLNDGFYRQNRHRVEGEIVRDLALSAAGLLSDSIGGPSVFPPLPPDVAQLSYNNNFKWNDSKGHDRYRRGMYTFFKRTAPHPNLTTFDCPDSNTTCVERRVSNTPLQALVLLNNDVFVEAAQAMARRALTTPAANDHDRLGLALRWCIARVPREEELSALLPLLSEARVWYASHPDDAKAAVGDFAAPGVPLAEMAAWVATTRVLLNLDEFLTRE